MGRKIEQLLLPRAGGKDRLDQPLRVVVIGGGLAGVAAATILAERGARVVLLEREAQLGGRAGAWPDRLEDGTSFDMERGFHAFFRQYYNLRRLLRRVDPELRCLSPMEDYPILGPDGRVESFRGLPRRSPWNIVALTRRTPTLGWRDLMRVNGRAALEMVRYQHERTYREFDDLSAGHYLDSLAFPPQARRMLFDVFAHSFFNPEEEMSAGELLMMFHYYFIGNPEGLVFDVMNQPFSRGLWQPLRAHLERQGAEVRTSSAARAIHRADAWKVELEDQSLDADLVVLGLEVPALQRLVDGSPTLDHAGWRAQVAGLDVTRPFVVWRMWLDRPVADGRAPFAGTTGVGILDNISVYEKLEDESREQARKRRGSVVELHAYAVPPTMTEEEVRADLLRGLHELYPETRDARIVEERYLLRQDCPSFAVGSHRDRPGVETPFEGLALAGDFARLPFPSALMERAVSSGFLAANTLLAPHGVRPEELLSVPRVGLLARGRAAS